MATPPPTLDQLEAIIHREVGPLKDGLAAVNVTLGRFDERLKAQRETIDRLRKAVEKTTPPDPPPRDPPAPPSASTGLSLRLDGPTVKGLLWKLLGLLTTIAATGGLTWWSVAPQPPHPPPAAHAPAPAPENP